MEKLQFLLGEHNHAATRSLRFRLRVALHMGEVRFDEHGMHGHDLVHAFRLIEAKEVKKALENSTASSILVVSDKIHEMVRGFTRPPIDSSTFIKHAIHNKETEANVWTRLYGTFPDAVWQAKEAALSSEPPATISRVHVEGSQGVIVGNGAHQVNNFGSELAGREEGVPEERVIDVYKVGGEAVEKHPKLVIVDCCSGVQIGSDNRRRNVFKFAVVPRVEIDEQLIMDMLTGKSSISSSFRTIADIELPERGSLFDWVESFKKSITDHRGDQILVVVRQSRGVEIGDDSVQVNIFHADIRDCTVSVDALSIDSVRRDAIDRLHADPYDREAAADLVSSIVSEATRALDGKAMGHRSATDAFADIDFTNPRTARLTEIMGIFNEWDSPTPKPHPRIAPDITDGPF